MQGKLVISEHFRSIQGEGQTMGKSAYFLRLAGCNLMCGGYGTEKDKELHDGATWRCDTIEVWRKGKSMSFDEIIEAMGGDVFLRDISEMKTHLIITGGEPLMQQEALSNFISHLSDVSTEKDFGDNFILEIETNGTIVPSDEIMRQTNYFNVSPKLTNSGMNYKERIVRAALSKLSSHRNAIFKFVLSNATFDWSQVQTCFLDNDRFGIRKEQVYLMPAAETREELRKIELKVLELCLKHKVNYSHRIHIEMWDKKTGV